MIHWIKKLNRSRNHHFKIYKFNLRLNLLCLLSCRYFFRLKKGEENTKNIAIPLIGKGIGDAIVISGLIDVLSKNNYKVSVIADKKAHFLFEGWNNLENLFLYDPENEKETCDKINKAGPFIFLDPHEITNSSINVFNLIRRTKPVRTIGFNEKFSIYDDIVKISNPNGHISGKCQDLLNHFDIYSTEPYDYVVRIPDEYKIEASTIINELGNKKVIAFIPYGSVSDRFFSDLQIKSILNFLSHYSDDMHVIIIGEQSKIQHINVEANASKNKFHSFFTAAQLIKESDLVITPDTSVVHLSRAFNKRMACFYPLKKIVDGADNADVWGPNYPEARQIRLTERKLADADIDFLIGCIKKETQDIINDTHQS